MKRAILIWYLILNASLLFSQSEKAQRNSFGAHPDDCDIDAGGYCHFIGQNGSQCKVCIPYQW